MLNELHKEFIRLIDGAAQAWLRGRVGRPYGEHHRPHLGGGEQQPDVHQLLAVEKAFAMHAKAAELHEMNYTTQKEVER